MTQLDLHHLSIARGQRILYRDLNLSINPGDFWGILGPNGAGKTTLLLTLGKQLPFPAGDLQLNGQSIKQYSARQIAQQIGMLFQETQFVFPQTVQEYCEDALYPRKSLFSRCSSAHAQHVQAVFESLSLQHLAKHSVQAISGGEQRRVTIAALLVQAPEIYLLDEPTNNLDLQHQAEIMKLLTRLSATKAVMMSVHDINLAARHCNKILMLFADGSTACGDTKDMLTSKRLSRLYQYPIDGLPLNDQTYWLPVNHQ